MNVQSFPYILAGDLKVGDTFLLDDMHDMHIVIDRTDEAGRVPAARLSDGAYEGYATVGSSSPRSPRDLVAASRR